MVRDRRLMSELSGSEAGFTLLELLIAITLLALVMLIATGGLRLGARAWEAGERRLDAGADIEHAQSFLARVIEQAYPAIVDETANVIDFEGSEDGLTLLSPMPRALGGGGFARVQLAMVGSSGSRALVIRWRLDLGRRAAGGGAPFEQTVLVEGIRRLAFAYYGTEQPAQAPHWQPSWRQRRHLPSLVRLRVELDPGKDRVWPDFVARPALHIDATCVYDPVDRACRGRT